VPLLYEPSSCAIMKAMKTIDWGHYKLQHENKLPFGPIVVLVHLYSTWIPYTSESKEAVDAYPEILKEIRLALQDCLRKIGKYLAGQRRRQMESKRQSLFEKYIPEFAYTMEKLTGEKKEKIETDLKKLLHKEGLKVEEDVGKEQRKE
jgi:DNA topoisomerase-6 subunit B